MTLSILKLLKDLFTKQLQTEKIDFSETLSRFIFERNHFVPSKRKIKASAFLPPLRNLQTSVFRKSRMNNVEYLSTKTIIEHERGKTIKATALITVDKVIYAGLVVEPDEINHKWHANIIKWPQGDDPESRNHRKEIAMILAQESDLE